MIAETNLEANRQNFTLDISEKLRLRKSLMEKSVLVVIVAPLIGHLTPTVQLAKLMLEKNHQLSISVLIMRVPIDPEGTQKIHKFIAGFNTERLHFHHLPTPENTDNWSSNRGLFANQLIEYQKPLVREFVSNNIKGLSGFILDMTTPTMVDVADEFGVPSYIFVTSGASFIGLMLHFQALEDENNQDIFELFKSNKELITPCFINRVPISVLPTVLTNKEHWSIRKNKYARGFRKARGMIVNTFAELEEFALNSFLNNSVLYGKSKLPQIFPVGPILNRVQTEAKNHSEIMEWLDNQPAESVVYVCFGSLGSFNSDQVKEIANGLERSGHRFIWVLRQQPNEKGGFPREFENLEIVLPGGFLDRTASIGKVVGWVPQLAVLSHSAVGGFVSHCGWNSILESIWCGVPIATWPLSGEQQLNAFQLVMELGMAVEISLDYNEAKEDQDMVRGERIEQGIRDLMNGENKARQRVKDLSEKSRVAVEEGGLSYVTFENVMQNICNSKQ